MKNILKDISGKIEAYISEIIIEIAEISKKNGVEFFIIGATARDLFFKYIYNISSPRATRDIDFAVRLKNWDEFRILTIELLKSTKIRQDKSLLYRFIYDNKSIFDIIPFGDIENPPGILALNKEKTKILSTLGFIEAYKSSEICIVSSNPECTVKICTPCGLAMMKLISWDQRYPERNSDAKDLYFIISQYINTGQDFRLYSNEFEKILRDNPNFDYNDAGPYLLGKDIAGLADDNTYDLVVSILNREFDEKSNFRLIGDILKDQYHDDINFKIIRRSLEAFKYGLLEKNNI